MIVLSVVRVKVVGCVHAVMGCCILLELSVETLLSCCICDILSCLCWLAGSAWCGFIFLPPLPYLVAEEVVIDVGSGHREACLVE